MFFECDPPSLNDIGDKVLFLPKLMIDEILLQLEFCRFEIRFGFETEN